MNLRALQLSDVHLDAQFRSPKLRLPEEKRKQRKTDIRRCLDDAFALAKDRSVDLILIPGDLWDTEAVETGTIGFLGDLFRRYADIPVFVSPGNHDYLSPNSPYDPSYLERLALRKWPENVHVFTEERFTTRVVLGRQDVTITGQCFRQNVRSDQRLLVSGDIPAPTTPISLMLFHGSRIGFEAGKDFITAPFHDGELLNLGYSYTALGHYHTFSTIEDRDGMIRASYSGSLVALGLDEPGPHGAQVVEIGPRGVQAGGIERIRLDPRQVHSICVDITGFESQEQIANKVLLEFKKHNVAKEDIVYLEVVGQISQGLELDFSERDPEEQCWHLAMEASVVPDYDLQTLAQGDSVEARFVREMQQQAASSKGQVYKDALFYGLDALRQKRLLNRRPG